MTYYKYNYFFIAISGGPNGIRTRVLALRGLRPRPLDDGTFLESRELRVKFKEKINLYKFKAS